MAKYFKETDKIGDIIKNYPETLEFFIGKGFDQFTNESALKLAGNLSLNMALKSKGINLDGFCQLLEEYIDLSRDSADITMNKRNKQEEGINILGLLPCPVANPILEKLKEFEEKSELKLNYDLKAAAHGLDWLKDDVKKETNPDNLADIFISAGFDLFFDEELMGKFRKESVFKDGTKFSTYNKDFQNDYINLKDPTGAYSMLAVVPAVFLINKKELGDREAPKTWADLLKPEFEKSVSLPVSDFDLFNAILLNINKKYGEEGVRKLGKSLIQSMHPAQMIKSDRLKSNKPAVTIMPYFFSRMAKEGGAMTAQWPEDGSIISPIFMLTKEKKLNEMEGLIDFLASKQLGEILSYQGLFPSISPEVDNGIGEDKKYMWLGWDYIMENNLQDLIHRCEEIFEEGTRD